MLIWHILDAETQKKLRKLLPETWQPPERDKRKVIVPLEKLQELEKMMRKAPASKRSLSD